MSKGEIKRDSFQTPSAEEMTGIDVLVDKKQSVVGCN